MEEIESKTQELLDAISKRLKDDDGVLEYLIHQKIIACLNRLKRELKKKK